MPFNLLGEDRVGGSIAHEASLPSLPVGGPRDVKAIPFDALVVHAVNERASHQGRGATQEEAGVNFRDVGRVCLHRLQSLYILDL